MDREYVNSTMIASFGFDPNNSTLEIEFRGSNSVWQYYDVLESVYYDMKSAPSCGKFFNANIKGRYTEAQVG